LILEAALLAAGRALHLEQLQGLFEEDAQPDKAELRQALQALEQDYAERAIELKEVGGGFRLQVRQDYAPAIANLWQERAPRYSRALLETLAIIAYRQPVTRGEIEEIRGVAVASNIIKTLSDRDWIRVVGRRDVPGRPALYATTRQFLDYFDLKSLDQLPTLAEIRDFDAINRELDLNDPDRLDESIPEPGPELGPELGPAPTPEDQP
jgi:segregation and condensation protein B